MPKTLENYVDVARRLVQSEVVLIKCENGDKYNGEVHEVRDSGGGRVVVVMAPGTSCWLSDEPEPFDLHPNTYAELPILVTTRVFPADGE
jgi:hypothetical protein